jgi:hypothetical protein
MFPGFTVTVKDPGVTPLDGVTLIHGAAEPASTVTAKLIAVEPAATI